MFHSVSPVRGQVVTAILAGLFSMLSGAAFATGEIGEDVNNLQAHLDEYAASVEKFIQQTDALVEAYAAEETAARPERLIDYWEEAAIHAAIEVNYVRIYAAIWQGIYGVKEAIDEDMPIEQVRAEQAALERTLWQALGAVKMAAKVQNERTTAAETTRPATLGTLATIDEIKQNLEQVVAKYAERATDEATILVHETYQNRFEGIEGELIEQDADLVLDLEKGFNVTLPQQLSGGADLDSVRRVVADMQRKLDRARTLLAEARKDRKEVF